MHRMNCKLFHIILRAPKTEGQKRYVDTVNKNDIVFSIGPAGTGKTFLSVAFAGAALDNNQIDSKVIGLMINDLNISSSNSVGDLEKNYSGVMEIIKLWIQNYKGEILEIKRILGRNGTKNYINTYHEKFLLENK